MNNNKLYVGNLPYGLTSEQLGALFQEFGTVIKADVVEDKYTKKSRGFGFVELESEAAAKAAVEALNEKKEVEGRKIFVSIARPRKTDENRSM